MLLRVVAIICLLPLCGFLTAQELIIPGYTGYATPVEKNGSRQFSEKYGLGNWTDTAQRIHFYFYAGRTGSVALSMDARNAVEGSRILVSVAGKKYMVSIPASPSYQRITLGELDIKDTGFYRIELAAVKKKGKQVAEIQALRLKGEATAAMHINSKPRRNAASVHLRYPLNDSIKATMFYNELMVPAGADVVHSYYMACGFARGYFGIQVNSEKERRVIFSIWDAGNEAVDRSKVPDSNRVQLLAKGDGVFADDFGNEGTGGHSHWVYNWKADETYSFIVAAVPDSVASTTIYTGYIFLPESKRWKMIASFRAPRDGNSLRNLYSFSENFVGINGQLQRKAFLGNQWIQNGDGRWMELTESSFSYDATGKARDRIDYGAGVADGKFYFWNGGFQPPTAQYGSIFKRPATKQRPLIDLTKDADSVVQAGKDIQLILNAIQAKQVDTTGSVQGVYYHLLQEGSGDYVSVNDTVTVYYKGSLLKDGSVFDQTKDKPSSFPLNRLIKGWQLALPKSKVGGKLRVIIPSGQAYSIRSRSKAIPPNSVLVFDIEVLGVKK